MSSLIALLVYLFARWQGAEIPLGWYLAIAAVLLIFGCFLAWRDEHRKVKSFKLSGEITDARVAVAENPPSSILFVFAGEVLNIGEKPTIAGKWKLDVRLPNDADWRHAENNFPPTGNLILISSMGRSEFHAANDLRAKATATPIVPGGMAAGWISFILRGIQLDSLPDYTTWRLSFSDITGTDYVCAGTNQFVRQNFSPAYVPTAGFER
jgi:hypothetical protein